MTDEYDEAVAKVEDLKREYAAHKEQKRIRRRPYLTGLAGLCSLANAGLFVSAGMTGFALILLVFTALIFVIAYRQWRALR